MLTDANVGSLCKRYFVYKIRQCNTAAADGCGVIVERTSWKLDISLKRAVLGKLRLLGDFNQLRSTSLTVISCLQLVQAEPGA